MKFLTEKRDLLKLNMFYKIHCTLNLAQGTKILQTRIYYCLNLEWIRAFGTKLPL